MDLSNVHPELIKDIYKYYLRATVELLSKYFDKQSKYIYLYTDEEQLFIEGDSLEEADKRINQMTTHARKKRKI